MGFVYRHFFIGGDMRSLRLFSLISLFFFLSLGLINAAQTTNTNQGGIEAPPNDILIKPPKIPTGKPALVGPPLPAQFKRGEEMIRRAYPTVPQQTPTGVQAPPTTPPVTPPGPGPGTGFPGAGEGVGGEFPGKGKGVGGTPGEEKGEFPGK